MQEVLLKLQPGLLPLFVFPLSFVQVWHCLAMCGPSFITKKKSERDAYILGKTLSYSLVGAVFGQFGLELRELLEVKMIGGLVPLFC